MRGTSIAAVALSALLSLALVSAAAPSAAEMPADHAGEALGGLQAVESATTTQPNFIVIVTDDQRFDAIGRCLPVLDGFDLDAGPDACMPELQERLTDHGTTFLKGEVTQSLCCPSRASILTGQYSTTTGVINNNGENFDDSSSVATWLDAAGYRTALVGKYLNGYGFGSLFEYVPPGWDAFHTFHDFKNGDDEPYVDYPWLDWQAGDASPTVTRYDDEDSTTGAACADGNYYSTDLICNRSVDFLQADTSQPFFLFITPAAPHSPNNPPDRHQGVFEDVVLPEYPDLNVLPSPNAPSHLPTRSLSQTALANMGRGFKGALEMSLAVDDMIGILHDQLEADGRLDDTVWIFISDNGLAAGEHRWREKSCEFYICHRVPFVIACPPGVCGDLPRGAVDDTNYALNIDIAPTIADLAGATPTLDVDGRSLLPILNDADADWRTEWFMYGSDPRYEGVVAIASDGATYKYLELTTAGEFELYDLDADPFELSNLAGNASYAAVQSELVVKLDAHRNGEEPPPLTSPTASFTWSCNELSCDFTDASTDADGSVVAWLWDFGDGQTSTVQHPSHGFAAAGSYSVTLTVTDDDGNSGSTAASVSVGSTGGGSTMHVADLDGASVSQGRTWLALVDVVVVDDEGAPVAGAEVTGTWRRGAVSTCTTAATGLCSIERSVRGGFETFTVDAVSHGSLSYDAAANTDPDGDSDGTSITVSRP